MIELEATIQNAGETTSQWKHALPGRAVTLGRVADQSEWVVPWDDQVSRKHIQLKWDTKAGKLQVQVLASARNPVYYQGQKHGSGAEFWVMPGERFIIGDTTFHLVQTQSPTPTPDYHTIAERTCSPQQLREMSYADADKRIEVLSELPEMIRQSPSDHEFEQRIVDVLLKGVPRAHTAALVWMDPDTATPTSEVRLQRLGTRESITSTGRISRRLVYSAVCTNRQTVLHRWGVDPDAGTVLNNQSLGISQWAICAPLADDAVPGWALYVAGTEIAIAAAAGPTLEQLQESDIKFVSTVAELVGALRSLRDLQKKQAILSRFFTRSVMSALVGQDIEAVLKPRVTDVTVICCDLRGSCMMAEEGEGNLQATCDRVSAALEEITTRITENDGVISDFQGDAAMCFWGWPQARGNDAERAAKAALAISRAFALLSTKQDHPLSGFACGIGLTSGPGVAGKLGTIDQFKLGVFGTTINLAARLESLTKVFKVPIIADDATATRLTDKVRLRRLARIQPYGMTRQLMIHEVLQPVGAEVTHLSENQRLDYEAALDKFLEGEWTGADKLLTKLRSDGPSLYLRNFMREKNMRPPTDWAGVIVISGK
jgi:adenylate cyclase